MGQGGKGSSESNQQTTNDQDFTDNRVAATDGSIGLGTGSSGNVINDSKIITQAGDALKGIADQSIQAAVKSSKNALDFGGDVVTESFGFGRDALGSVERTVQQANDVLARTSEGYAANLRDNAGVAPSTIVGEYGKYAMVLAAGLGALYLLKKK